MAAKIENLDWIRGIQVAGQPDFGHRLYRALLDVQTHLQTLEQQTNSNLEGTPAAPPSIQAVNVIPHPQGVDIAIQHEGEFYDGMHYEIDHADNPHFRNARTADIGNTRNHVLPVGQWNGYYQVRARYGTGQSTPPCIFGGATPQVVSGGSVTAVTLLPTQGAGTTKPGQPTGFGGPYRSATGKPPKRAS